MPNWCLNRLAVYGPELEVNAFRKRAVGHSPWTGNREGEEANLLNFHNLVPIPAEVLTAGYDPAGINWERGNWGCAYGAYGSEIVDEWEGLVAYAFLTAWSPPIEFLTAAAKQFAAFTFMLDYNEPDVGFKGIAKFKGETVEHYSLDY